MNEKETIKVCNNKTKKEAISRIIGYMSYWRKEGVVIEVKLSHSA